MTDRDAFLRAICDSPADDTARLVFADWLEEHGEAARAEFIRVEVQIANRNPDGESDDRRRAALFARRAELFKAHGRAWLEPFLGCAKESGFERGFVAEVEATADMFLTHGERWATITPLTRVRFVGTLVVAEGAAVEGCYRSEELFASPVLARLGTIDLESNRVTPDDMRRLAACPDLSRLRELVLAWNGLGSEGAGILAGMPQLRGLEELNLQCTGITASGARAIAQSPYLGGLKELLISKNPIRGKAWTMLELRFGTALVG
jgi:uncharacterized protein (TIGR02996 family)